VRVTTASNVHRSVQLGLHTPCAPKPHALCSQFVAGIRKGEHASRIGSEGARAQRREDRPPGLGTDAPCDESARVANPRHGITIWQPSEVCHRWTNGHAPSTMCGAFRVLGLHAVWCLALVGLGQEILQVVEACALHDGVLVPRAVRRYRFALAATHLCASPPAQFQSQHTHRRGPPTPRTHRTAGLHDLASTAVYLQCTPPTVYAAESCGLSALREGLRSEFRLEISYAGSSYGPA